MTRYEKLQAKRELCQDAARRTIGEMRIIWDLKARELDRLARGLEIIEAER